MRSDDNSLHFEGKFSKTKIFNSNNIEQILNIAQRQLCTNF